MRRLACCLTLSLVVLVACSSSPDNVGGDSEGGAEVVADVPLDSFVPDVAPETVAADIGAEDVEHDASSDVGEAPVVEAELDALCPLGERVGQLFVGAEGSRDAPLYLNALVLDRVHPWMPTAPEQVAGVCGFYQQPPAGTCDPACENGLLCASDNECRPEPMAVADQVVTLRTADDEQTFAADGPQGAWGQVTLPGREFSLEWQFAGTTVTLPTVAVPGMLEGATGQLSGSLDQPTGLDLAWSVPEDPARVATNIPVNHHAGGQTFTLCDADAATGTMHVDGDLLAPLAVITGLEFQGIEHVRYAAATTPLGCVEVRFRFNQYVDLSY